MNSKPAIVLKNLCKFYDIYRRPADLLIEFVTRMRRHTEFHALTDINMEIHRGETVGFIGRNGAGKSTLLKVIAGTLCKTSGELHINGRISAILELGTGFNPEYTGLENIYMGGICLGMSRAEIDSKLDSIIDFSELRDFINQPFKTYSSGMQARLTFATAIAPDPEILIVDEALSVGDARFARKCYDKIEDFRSSGKTILMVSHDMNTITSFCNRAILLERGRVIDEGNPKYVTMGYYKLNTAPTGVVYSAEDDEKRDAVLIKNSDRAEVLDYGVRDLDGNPVPVLTSGEKYVFFVRCKINDTVERPGFGFLIRSRRGVDLFGTDTRRLESVPVRVPPLHKGDILEGTLEVTMNLTNHDFFLSAGIAEDGNPIEFRYDGRMFTVRRTPGIQHASLVNMNEFFQFKILKAEES